jgi:hypothetical protein
VQFNGHRGSGSRPRAGALLTPQQQAAAFERAVEWRQEWRAEVAGRHSGNGHTPEAAPARPKREPQSARAAFAAGIARAEFGRFYWDAKKHRLPAGERKPRRQK